MAKFEQSLDDYGSWIWTDQSAPSSRLILFVHGYTGHPMSTWRRFPDLIRQVGQGFEDDYDVGSFGYKTRAVVNHLDLETVTGLFKSHIEVVASSADRIYIVAHSLGGLVVRNALLAEWTSTSASSLLRKIRQVHMVGAPTRGAWFLPRWLAMMLPMNRLAASLSWNNHELRRLVRGYREKVYLKPSASGLDAPPLITNYIGASDHVVPVSAIYAALKDEHELVHVVPASHSSLVKPHTAMDPVYQLITRAIRSDSPRPQDCAADVRALRPRSGHEERAEVPFQDLIRLGDSELILLMALVALAAHQRPVAETAAFLWGDLDEEAGVVARDKLTRANLIVSTQEGVLLHADVFDRIATAFYSDEPPGLTPRAKLKYVRDRLERPATWSH